MVSPLLRVNSIHNIFWYHLHHVNMPYEHKATNPIHYNYLFHTCIIQYNVFRFCIRRAPVVLSCSFIRHSQSFHCSVFSSTYIFQCESLTTERILNTFGADARIDAKIRKFISTLLFQMKSSSFQSVACRSKQLLVAMYMRVSRAFGFENYCQLVWKKWILHTQLLTRLVISYPMRGSYLN